MKETLLELELCQVQKECKIKKENSRAVQPTKTKVEFKASKKGEELLCLY